MAFWLALGEVRKGRQSERSRESKSAVRFRDRLIQRFGEELKIAGKKGCNVVRR